VKFIDLFNFYPVQVNKLRYKNDSNELTYVMSGNTKGSKEVLVKNALKNEEDQNLLALLQLVSDKIY
jgi:hypothetical protein